MENKLCFYNDFKEFEMSEFYKLSSFHWESTPPYRPDTFFKIGVVGGELVVVLKCLEENPRAVFTERDAPVYKDSCLEFFVAPVDGRQEYINVEMNSRGAYLCEFGKGKPDRVLASSLTMSSPVVEPFYADDTNDSYWGVKVTLTRAFISQLYNITADEITFDKIRANFYKCGDDCETPHYLAFSPVTTLPPGFHNPDCFATFVK